jgi:peptidyl-prolyl cis-trans isomerase SurA
MPSPKRPLLLAALLALPAALAPVAAPPAAAQLKNDVDINRIVLRVNDEVFTLYDYEEGKARMSARLMSDPGISPAQRQEKLAGVGKEVLQQALHDMLLLSQAKRTAVTVSDHEVDASIEQVKKEQGLESQEDFEVALSQAGLTIDELRANFRRDMSTGRLVQKEVTSKIEVSDDVMRSYYKNHPEEFKTPEERKLREVIVLEASGLPDAELAKQAAKLQQELSAPGAKAAEVVGRYQDQGYSSGLIDLGWLKKGELEKSLSEAAWGLEVGRYAAPIKARGGYHLVFLEEKRGGELQAYADVQNQIQGRERQKRFGKEYRSYLAQLEKGSYIQENPPAEAVGYRSLLGAAPEEDELKGFRAPLPVEPPAGAAAAGTKVDEPAAAKKAAAAAPPLVVPPTDVTPVDPTPRDVTPTDGVPTETSPADPAVPIPPPTGSGGSGGG